MSFQQLRSPFLKGVSLSGPAPGVSDIAVTDSGSGVDALSMLGLIPISDTGSGTDTNSFLALVSQSDSGSGVDNISLLSLVNVTDGIIGYTLQLDGVDDGVSITSYTPPTTAFTVAFWMYKNGPQDNNDRVVDWQDGGPINGFTFVLLEPSKTIQFVIGGATEQARIGGVGISELAENTWYFIVGTYAVNDTRFYINAVSVGTDNSCTMVPAATTTVSVGKRTAGSNYMRGAVDDLMIFNRALTQQEITDLYRYRTIPSGLDCHLNFDGNVNDQSGNGHNGTIVGSAAYGNSWTGGFVGIGVDSVTAFPSVAISDTGSGADTLSLLGIIPVADSGSGVDTIQITGFVYVRDTLNNKYTQDFESPAAGNTILPTGAVSYGATPTYKGNANDFSNFGGQSFKISNASLVDTGIYFIVSGLTIGVPITVKVYVKTTVDVTNANITVDTVQHGIGGAKTTTTKVSGLQSGYFIVEDFVPDKTSVNIFLGLGSFGPTSLGTVWYDDLELNEHSGSDSISILQLAGISDTGSGSDAQSILALVPVTDSGSGIDAVSVSAGITAITVTDSGIGADILSVIQNIAISDSMTGDDVISILRMISITDSASGNEQINLLLNAIISDVASGIDTLTVFRLLTEHRTIVLGTGNIIAKLKSGERNVKLKSADRVIKL